MDLGLQLKVALVTGGSSGIGRACAAELAREGARVCIVARDQAGLAEPASKHPCWTAEALPWTS